jgi:hypothetical protein
MCLRNQEGERENNSDLDLLWPTAYFDSNNCPMRTDTLLKWTGKTYLHNPHFVPGTVLVRLRFFLFN